MNGGTGKTFFKYGVKALKVRTKVKTASTDAKTASMDNKTVTMDVKTSTMFGVFKNNRYLCSQNVENYVCKVYQTRGCRFKRHRLYAGLLQDGIETHELSAVREFVPS